MEKSVSLQYHFYTATFKWLYLLKSEKLLEKYKSAERELAYLKEEIEPKRNELQALRVENTQLRNENQLLRKENERLTQDNEYLIKTREHKEYEINELQEKLEETNSLKVISLVYFNYRYRTVHNSP